MEPAIRKMYRGIELDKESNVDQFVLKRYIENKHKMEQPPIAQLGRFDTTYGE